MNDLTPSSHVGSGSNCTRVLRKRGRTGSYLRPRVRRTRLSSQQTLQGLQDLSPCTTAILLPSLLSFAFFFSFFPCLVVAGHCRRHCNKQTGISSSIEAECNHRLHKPVCPPARPLYNLSTHRDRLQQYSLCALNKQELVPMEMCECRALSKPFSIVHLSTACTYQREGAHPMLPQLWFPSSGRMQDCCHFFYNFHPLHNT